MVSSPSGLPSFLVDMNGKGQPNCECDETNAEIQPIGCGFEHHQEDDSKQKQGRELIPDAKCLRRPSATVFEALLHEAVCPAVVGE